MLGDEKILNKFSIAIVGARKASTESLEIAETMSLNLSKNDIQIISGMALGIDSAGHRGALDAGGKTIAVLRIWI